MNLISLIDGCIYYLKAPNLNVKLFINKQSQKSSFKLRKSRIQDIQELLNVYQTKNLRSNLRVTLTIKRSIKALLV